MAFPLSRTMRTACALNSFVNARRFRLAMTHSYRPFVRSEVSTKSGQAQFALRGRPRAARASRRLAVDAAPRGVAAHRVAARRSRPDQRAFLHRRAVALAAGSVGGRRAPGVTDGRWAHGALPPRANADSRRSHSAADRVG